MWIYRIVRKFNPGDLVACNSSVGRIMGTLWESGGRWGAWIIIPTRDSEELLEITGHVALHENSTELVLPAHQNLLYRGGWKC